MIERGKPRFRIVQGKGYGERNPPREMSLQERPSPSALAASSPTMSNVLFPAKVLQRREQAHQMPMHPQAPLRFIPAFPQAPVYQQRQCKQRVYRPLPDIRRENNQVRDNIKAPFPVEFTNSIRLFEKILRNSKDKEPEGSFKEKIPNLIKDVIFNNLPIENFLDDVQKFLDVDPHPNYIADMLRRTLPQLKQGILCETIEIEGLSIDRKLEAAKSATPLMPLQSGSKYKVEQDFYQEKSYKYTSSPLMHPENRGILVTKKECLSSQENKFALKSEKESDLPMKEEVKKQISNLGMASPQKYNAQNSKITLEMAMNAMGNQQQPITPEVKETKNPSVAEIHEEEEIPVRMLRGNGFSSNQLSSNPIMNKIAERLMHNAFYAEEEVLGMLSDTIENKIREILENLAKLARHRTENLKANKLYQPIDDTKAQLRTVENLNSRRQEHEEYRRKEAFVRTQILKGKAGIYTKEMIDKARDAQKTEEIMRNSANADAAAIAALKTERPRISNDTHAIRPRTVRITIRDLHALGSSDKQLSQSAAFCMIVYGGYNENQ